MSAARMKHFGWGREGEGLSADEEAFVMARAEARFGTTLDGRAPARRALDEITLEAPRVTAPASLPFCTSDHYDRAAHTYGKSYPELARGLARDYANAPDVVAYPRDESDVAAVLDWAGGRRRDGDAVRRRIERVRRRRAAARNGHKGAVTIDLRRHGQGEGGRQDLARRADRGRHLRPGARSAAASARAHAAPFSAELRIFDARRLDRDARRRPFRDALHPHRRSRGIAAHGDAERHDRKPPPARLRRGPEPGPHDDRLGRHSRHHHAGLDAAAGSPDVPRRRRGALQGLLHRGARGARDRRRPGSTRRIAASSIRPRPTTPAPPTARSPSWCWPSSRPITTSAPWMERARECCADHGGVPEASGAEAHREGAAGVWRNAFIRMPYAMERLILRGVINDTFETSITWERFEEFHDAIKRATENCDPRRRPGARARSPAASPMSIRTARRPTSPSMRSASRASSARNGSRSRARRSMP